MTSSTAPDFVPVTFTGNKGWADPQYQPQKGFKFVDVQCRSTLFPNDLAVYFRPDNAATGLTAHFVVTGCPPAMLTNPLRFDASYMITAPTVFSFRWTEVTARGSWKYCDSEYLIFVHQSGYQDRYVLPEFAVHHRHLQTRPTVHPKAHILAMHNLLAPITVLPPLPWYQSATPDAPFQDGAAVTPVADNNGEPQPYALVVVYGSNHLLWWIGYDPKRKAVISSVWVDAEGVPDDRCLPCANPKVTPALPGFVPLPALPENDFGNEVYLRLRGELGDRADSLIPSAQRLRPSYFVYRQRGFFVNVVTAPPGNSVVPTLEKGMPTCCCRAELIVQRPDHVTPPTALMRIEGASTTTTAAATAPQTNAAATSNNSNNPNATGMPCILPPYRSAASLRAVESNVVQNPTMPAMMTLEEYNRLLSRT